MAVRFAFGSGELAESMTVSDLLFPGRVLAIETSCDETSAAVVQRRSVLSNVVATQIEMHQKWGGVVPEAAARSHTEAIVPVVDEALRLANLELQDIDGFAVTTRPGLVGALSVGASFAKGLALSTQKPIVGVHHIEGHLLSILAADEEPLFPMVSLVASGGHSELVLIESLGSYRLLGETRDDAAGEAFDKTARLLGLGYPGGRAIQELAPSGNPKAFDLPRALGKRTYEMSFSGLKTAVLRHVESAQSPINAADMAASVQAAIVDVLIARLEYSIQENHPRSIALVGGVSANKDLRNQATKLGERYGVQVIVPPFSLCTDNAAMIGLAGAFRLGSNVLMHTDRNLSVMGVDELPGLVRE